MLDLSKLEWKKLVQTAIELGVIDEASESEDGYHIHIGSVELTLTREEAPESLRTLILAYLRSQEGLKS